MLRDELIEELKKAPTNSEVYIEVTHEGECVEAKIDRITTIPRIVLEGE